MVIFQFKLCGLSIKRGWLFGRRENPPIHTLNMLLCRAFLLDGKGAGKVIEATSGLCDDPLWLIENRKEIEMARESAVRKARLEYAERKEGEMQRLKERLNEASDENRKLRTENHALRRAIRIVEEEPCQQ